VIGTVIGRYPKTCNKRNPESKIWQAPGPFLGLGGPLPCWELLQA
jgi:hypothetical protein